MTPVKIILADDHPIIISGIREVMEKDSRYRIIAEYNDGQSLLNSEKLSYADVLLLDLNMPRADGLRVLKKLKLVSAKAENNKLKIIVITAYLSKKLAEECRALGASAYVLKTENLSKLTNIISSVTEGETVFPDFSASENEAENDYSYFDSFLNKYKLTKREVEIIRLICAGQSANEIADCLNVSAFTIQTHRKNIFKKLNLDLNKSVLLYDFALKNGLI